MGTESEISSAICYLLSDAAAFVSGVTLRVDGAASQGTRMYPFADATNSQSLMASIEHLFLMYSKIRLKRATTICPSARCKQGLNHDDSSI